MHLIRLPVHFYLESMLLSRKNINMKSFRYIVIIAAIITAMSSCKKMLEVTPDAEFSPGNVLSSEKGIKALLYSSYQSFQGQPNTRDIINISEVTTDMAINSGGNENLYLTQFINFSWDASMGQMQGVIWAPAYRTIRDANLVLENIDQVETTEAIKKLYTAEAKFLRALSYTSLYSWYGPVPLRISSEQEKDLPKATDVEVKALIEKDLTESIADLPDPGKEEVYGRATKGAALGILAKFYLNTKQWQKASDAAGQLINLNYYQLYPVFKDLFKVENEKNKEMIFVITSKTEMDYGNWFSAGAMPPAFLTTAQLPEFKWVAAIQNFATQYRLRDELVNTFAANDARYVLVVRSYTNTSNANVNLTSTANNTRSFKYFDNNAVGNSHGNDIPVVRYADILLTRAEALNEVNGVNIESVSLINQVRARAGIAPLDINSITSKEQFRTFILRERGWEFISEGKRREDLIRQDLFISRAIARGVAAKPHQVVFPIPQVEIDANKAMVQNAGY
jgi:hypothetical protein